MVEAGAGGKEGQNLTEMVTGCRGPEEESDSSGRNCSRLAEFTDSGT